MLLHALDEVRAEGRVISGTIVHWGEVSPSHREKFAAGSIDVKPDPWLTWRHDRSRVLAYGDHLRFPVDDTGFHLEAILPPIPLADMALEEIRAGRLTGLSIDMKVKRDRREHGLRVIEHAVANGAGIVPSPAYLASRISEVRQRDKTRILGKVKLDKKLPCLCHKQCENVVLKPGSFDKALAEARAGAREIHAFLTGSYETPIASVRAGNLGIEVDRETLDVYVDSLPVLDAVEQFMEDWDATFYTARPYFPSATSKIVKDGTTAIVEEADLRAIELAVVSGPTTNLEPLEIEPEQRSLPRIWL